MKKGPESPSPEIGLAQASMAWLLAVDERKRAMVVKPINEAWTVPHALLAEGRTDQEAAAQAASVAGEEYLGLELDPSKLVLVAIRNRLAVPQFFYKTAIHSNLFDVAVQAKRIESYGLVDVQGFAHYADTPEMLNAMQVFVFNVCTPDS